MPRACPARLFPTISHIRSALAQRILFLLFFRGLNFLGCSSVGATGLSANAGVNVHGVTGKITEWCVSVYFMDSLSANQDTTSTPDSKSGCSEMGGGPELYSICCAPGEFAGGVFNQQSWGGGILSPSCMSYVKFDYHIPPSTSSPHKQLSLTTTSSRSQLSPQLYALHRCGRDGM